jgi:hypothetical protein
MVAIQDSKLAHVALGEVANQTRTVPRNAPLIAAGLAVGTSFGVPDLDVSLAEATPVSVD